MRNGIQGAFPILPYPDPRAAIAWLERVLGAETTALHPSEPDQPVVHAELRVGTGIVMLNQAGRTDGSPFASPGPVVLYVVVDDADALHDLTAGAEPAVAMHRAAGAAWSVSPPRGGGGRP